MKMRGKNLAARRRGIKDGTPLLEEDYIRMLGLDAYRAQEHPKRQQKVRDAIAKRAG